MYHHIKKLMHTVRVEEPDPHFGNMLLNSSAARMAGWQPGCSIPFKASTAKIPIAKDLLMDIGTEELSHLEIVGCLARMHLKAMKFDREKAAKSSSWFS